MLSDAIDRARKRCVYFVHLSTRTFDDLLPIFFSPFFFPFLLLSHFHDLRARASRLVLSGSERPRRVSSLADEFARLVRDSLPRDIEISNSWRSHGPPPRTRALFRCVFERKETIASPRGELRSIKSAIPRATRTVQFPSG